MNFFKTITPPLKNEDYVELYNQFKSKFIKLEDC